MQSERVLHIAVSTLTGHTSIMEAKIRIFGFSGFSENADFGIFPMGLAVWEVLQSIGNGCGLQMDGFSTHFEPYGSIFNDFDDLNDFASFFDGLTLFSEGPGTLRDPPEGP